MLIAIVAILLAAASDEQGPKMRCIITMDESNVKTVWSGAHGVDYRGHIFSCYPCYA